MQWHKYILTFVITATIFATAFFVANKFDAQRVAVWDNRLWAMTESAQNVHYSFDITTFLDQIADETRSPGEQEFLELQQERDRLAEELDRFTAARAAIETAGHHIALIKQAWSTA